MVSYYLYRTGSACTTQPRKPSADFKPAVTVKVSEGRAASSPQEDASRMMEWDEWIRLRGRNEKQMMEVNSFLVSEACLGLLLNNYGKMAQILSFPLEEFNNVPIWHNVSWTSKVEIPP